MANSKNKPTLANSTLILTNNRSAVVELHPQHPGFNDVNYRDRRNKIAQMALDFKPDQKIPIAPYTQEEHSVWELIYKDLEPQHVKYACSEARRSIKQANYSKKRIPHLRDVSAQINSKTNLYKL